MDKKTTSKPVEYHTKLVGVTFEGRQAIISLLKGGESVMLRREPENEHDKQAVAVDVMIGEEFLPIGYIAADKNEEVAKALDAGMDVAIKLSSITGGTSGRSRGVNIHLAYTKAPKVVKSKTEAPRKSKVTKQQAVDVLTYLLETVNGKNKIDTKPEVENTTEKYNSKLLGSSIDITVVNGHKRLEGYLSGSHFPDAFYAPFDKEGILKAIALKYGKTENEQKELLKAIPEMWQRNSQASTGYGTAVHAALENYDINFTLGDKIKSVKSFKTKSDEVGPNKALSKNPFIKKIVEDFHEKFGGDYVRFSEEFIWNKEFKLCGSVDRIKVVDFAKRVIRIQDFKTDGNIHEKKYQLTSSPFYPLTQGANPEMGKELLDLHWLQLSFYAYILTLAGWTVEGLDIYWLNPTKLAKGENAWEEFSREVINISSQFEDK